MLRQRIIPSLLLRRGRLVKGVRYADHRDAGLPHTTARAHNAQNADELLLLDIDASREARAPDLETIALVARECFMPLTAGGGIRSVADARAVLGAGADKVCLTATALDAPPLIGALARLLGSQAVVIGIDAVAERGRYRLYDHRARRATDRDALDWLEEAVSLGAGEARLMAVDREGARTGMDLELLARARRRARVPLVLEGGAGTLSHVDEALTAGADGVALGTMLVFSDNNIVKVRRYLTERGRNIRR